MADSKKYDGSQWEHSLHKLTTATEAVENPLYSDGTAITSYTIKGNTVQNGTPTPSAPIAVQGVGELDSGQYKIPISSANTTTPVYLGDVQSTRWIKQLVLTGEETWFFTSGFFFIHNITPDYLRTSNRIVYCTHYQGINSVTAGGQVGNGECSFYIATNTQRFYIKDDDYATIAEFKTYLAQQYAAGTPVTVWYVLAEPTTGIVNEPLMKIGTYADTLSNAASIPTIEGANSITVDTTVQPSEFTATWTGWHDAGVKEKSRNLFDKNANDTDNGYVSNVQLRSDGAEISESGFNISEYISCNASTQYTLKYREEKYTFNNPSLCFYDASYNFIDGINYGQVNPITITTPSNAAYMRISYRTVDASDVMLNIGSTIKPYEPYWK